LELFTWVGCPLLTGKRLMDIVVPFIDNLRTLQICVV